MTYRPNARYLEVEDTVEGYGRHRAESRIHLHPDVRLTREGEDFVLEREGIRCVFRTTAPAALEKGWHAPEFGKRTENAVIVLGGTSSLPTALSYTISLDA